MGGATRGTADGMGLGSVRRRLAALYGERATISIDRMAAGFTITIALPLKPAEGLGSAA